MAFFHLNISGSSWKKLRIVEVQINCRFWQEFHVGQTAACPVENHEDWFSKQDLTFQRMLEL